ncbi:MAG: MFS transporter [Marmoricola sp.]
MTFDAPTRRVIVSHTLAALALSLPWPLLLVLVAEQSDDPWLLGLAGAARMLPFVLCSWVGGRLADAMRRDLIVRATLVVRIVTLVVAALAVVEGQVWVAVAATTLAVAVATPAYPAVVAAMPGVAGDQSRRATHLLVTIEVGSFVVGAALGGLLLHPAARAAVPWVGVVLTVLALAIVLPVSMPAPDRQDGRVARPSGLAALRESPAARRAIAVMAVVNLVDAVAALALLPVALETWSAGATGYGIATGVLGFSALAAPVLRHLGPTPARAMRRGLVLAGLGLLLLTPAPGLVWALVPIAVLGAASVGVEAAATGVLQESVPDEVRATILGLNDSIIISAALLGALAAPALVAVTGGRVVFAALAATTLLVAWWARPLTTVPRPRTASAVLVPAAVGATR